MIYYIWFNLKMEYLHNAFNSRCKYCLINGTINFDAYTLA